MMVRKLVGSCPRLSVFSPLLLVLGIILLIHLLDPPASRRTLEAGPDDLDNLLDAEEKADILNLRGEGSNSAAQSPDDVTAETEDEGEEAEEPQEETPEVETPSEGGEEEEEEADLIQPPPGDSPQAESLPPQQQAGDSVEMVASRAKVRVARLGPLELPRTQPLAPDALTSQPLPRATDDWKFVPYDSAFFGVDVKAAVEGALAGDPTHPLDNYRNPCWKSRLAPEGAPMEGYTMVCHWGPDECARLKRIYLRRVENNYAWRLRCLPYFLLTGVTRAGVTDLRFFLSRHPLIERPLLSEINWWNRRRQGYLKRPFANYGNVTFDEYLAMFDMAAREIGRGKEEGSDQPWHPKITYDGSSFTLWEHDGWENIPLNQGLREPKVTLIHSLRRLQPRARIVVLLRNPVDRLYSHYWALKREGADPADFHERSREAIDVMQQCFSRLTVRQCAFHTKLHEDIYADKLTLRASLYSVWLEEWLRVFPREQMLVIRAEDYYQDRKSILDAISNFLGLGVYKFEDPDIQIPDIRTAPAHQARPDRPEMSERTRAMLQDFFRPFNARLAQLTDHAGFLWDTPQ